MFEMSVKAVCVFWMVLLGVVCCLDHMAWASAAGMQSMVYRSHMPTCTDAVVTPTISCTSPKTSCKAQHTCVANNKAAVAHRFQTVTAKTQMPNQQNHTQAKTDAPGQDWPRCETNLQTRQSGNVSCWFDSLSTSHNHQPRTMVVWWLAAPRSKCAYTGDAVNPRY